jgi:hypothetical protein
MKMCKLLFNNTRWSLKYFKLNMWKQEPEGRQLNGDCWDCSGDTLYSYFYLFANRHWTCKTSFDIEDRIHIQIEHALLCEQVYWSYCISSKIHMNFHVKIIKICCTLFLGKINIKRGLVLLWFRLSETPFFSTSLDFLPNEICRLWFLCVKRSATSEILVFTLICRSL